MDLDLQLRAALDVSIARDDDTLALRVGGPLLHDEPWILRTFAAFCQPKTLREALLELPADLEAERFSKAVERLLAVGALRPVADSTPMAAAVRFDAPVAHIEMLDDRRRTEGYLAAIREVVRPDDVVVDLGTGTGVLAVAAAKAGARRVFAIEAGEIANLAAELAASNGVADRVEIIRGWSSAVSLPERGTVLVSENIGDEPLGERVLQITADARRRLLTPDARLLPFALRIYVELVEVPEPVLEEFAFTPAAVRRWRDAYGWDLSSLATLREHLRAGFTATRATGRRCPRLSAPTLLTEIDLRSHATTTLDVEAPCQVIATGTVNAAIVSAELVLTPTLTVSTRSDQPGQSWRPYLHRVETRGVETGQSLTVRYRYGYDAPRVELRLAP